jgi:RNA polymerase sigma-70 factor (ECF subfamily)
MNTSVRIAWTLRMVEGLELAEVASACGCSLATAKRRIAAAEVVVRAHIGPPERDEEEEAAQ